MENKLMEFAETTANEAQELLRRKGEDDITVKATEVLKMNDQQLAGLTFQKGSEPAPTYYVNEMYHAYQEGVDKDEMLAALIDSYIYDRDCGPAPEENEIDMSSPEDNVGVRLLGKAYNRRYLETVPYRDVGNGLALVCDIRIGASDGGLFSTVITYDMVEKYGYNMEKLFDRAIENAQKDNPASIQSIRQILTDMADMDDGGDLPEDDVCYSLSTDRQRFGAAALFYPGMPEKVAEAMKGDFVAIPSSIHEFIIVKPETVHSIRELRDIIITANNTIVQPDEVLSDDPLYYRESTGELFVAADEN